MSFDLGSLFGAGAGIIGGLMGGSDKNNSQTSVSPWKRQAPFLLGGFQSAAGLYKNYMNKDWYGGDLYANMNGLQKGAATGANNFAGGQGMSLSRDMIQGSQPYLGQGGNFLSAANRLSNFDPGAKTNANPLLNFNNGNAARENLQDAGKYINNDILRGQIDAASRDVNRNLTEDVLPQVGRAAAVGGNTNSTRTGIAEGIALRGAQDRVGDISAQLRGDAYNNGLALAENSRQADNANRLSATGAGLSLTEDGRQFNQNTRMNGMNLGAGYLNTAVGRGMDLRNQGMQGMVNMYDLMGRAGDKFQQNSQNQLNSNFQRWQGQYNQPWDLLSRYMGAVGGANYGSQTNQSTPGTWQGAVQGALGGAASGYGLYQNFSNLMNSGASSQAMRAPYNPTNIGGLY